MSGGTGVTTVLRPLGDRVLLRRIEQTQRGGLRTLQMDGTEEVQVNLYEVVAVGLDDLASLFCHGDRVYVARHKPWKVETPDGDELYVVEATDLLLIEVEKKEENG